MPGITVRLLGAVEMRDAHGREMQSLPSQPKRFGLLAFLATADPRGFHSRDKLQALFWPEANHEHARHSLNQALHVLRCELGEGAIRSRGDNAVAINGTLIASDVLEFDRSLEAGEYDAALHLYRGDLMEGLFLRDAPDFERWLDDERTRLREEAAGAAWGLAHEHLGASRPVDAERTAQRALQLVPTDESEVRRFIQALANSGERAAAVRFYQRFAKRLRLEYEIEPDPVTEAAFRALAIRRDDPREPTGTLGETSATRQATPRSPSGDTARMGAKVGGAKKWWRELRIGVAATALGIVVTGAALLVPRWRGRALAPDRVLIVALEEEGESQATGILGRWVQDYIIQVLADADFADVVLPQTAGVVRMTAEPRDVVALAQEAGARTVVWGDYHVAGDSLYVQVRITDAGDGSVIGTVGPVIGSVAARRELVAALGQEVVARLASQLDHELEDYEPTVAVATYQAYEAYVEGLDVLGSGETVAAARHFERAAATDSTFYRAMLWAAHSYLWSGPPYQGKVESWLTTLEASRSHLTRYERCRLDFLTAIAIRPSLRTAYDAAHCMAQAAPGYAKAKDEVAFLALRSFHPREAIDVLKGLDHQDPMYWELLTMAYHMLGDHETELEAAEAAAQQFPGHFSTVRAVARALAALGRVEDVKARVPEMLPLGMVAADVADELRVHGHPTAARDIVDSAIAWYESRQLNRFDLAALLHRAGRCNEARKLVEDLAKASPEDPQILAFLGVLAARRGDRAEALRISDELRSVENPPLMKSWLTLQRAKIAALLGDRFRATKLLRQGISRSPAWSYPQWPHRDIDFESLQGDPAFEELMRPIG